MQRNSIKELIFYIIILVIIIAFIICNNLFWKIGKNNNEQSINEKSKKTQLIVNNITYNVPFEKKWLD